jgi:glycosyltransferase involved in cell wall biosynthesis
MYKPFISIIVTAYNRRKYIRQAIQSVINSTLPRDSYELIVVKNFRDEFVDNIVEKLGGKSVLVDIAPIGANISIGIRMARGDVITFLEDDDMYHPVRLEVIADVFRRDPTIIYYHNNVVVIDELNSPVYDKMIERTNIPRKVVAKNGEEKLNAFKLYKWCLGLRPSAMAVRRSFIARWVNIIKLFPDLVDILIYLFAIVNEGTVLHDPRRLTYYRVSETSASSVRFVKDPVNRFIKAIKNAARHALARHMLVALAKYLGLSSYVGYDEATVIGCIYRNCGRYSAHIIANLENCKTIMSLGVTMVGVTYLLNPTLAKRLVYLYYTRLFNLCGLRF